MKHTMIRDEGHFPGTRRCEACEDRGIDADKRQLQEWMNAAAKVQGVPLNEALVKTPHWLTGDMPMKSAGPETVQVDCNKVAELAVGKFLDNWFKGPRNSNHLRQLNQMLQAPPAQFSGGHWPQAIGWNLLERAMKCGVLVPSQNSGNWFNMKNQAVVNAFFAEMKKARATNPSGQPIASEAVTGTPDWLTDGDADQSKTVGRGLGVSIKLDCEKVFELTVQRLKETQFRSPTAMAMFNSMARQQLSRFQLLSLIGEKLLGRAIKCGVLAETQPTMYWFGPNYLKRALDMLG